MNKFFIWGCLFLVLGCRNNTHTLKTRDGKEIKIILPDNMKISTDSVQITYADKLQTNTMNWNLHGNEPFWNISIHGDSVIYKTPTSSKNFKITFFSKDIDQKGNSSEYEYTLEDRKQADKAFIKIIHQSCSDGMSDQQFTYSASFAYKNDTLKGCAEKK
jgi:uncharacterized membrane protein